MILVPSFVVVTPLNPLPGAPVHTGGYTTPAGTLRQGQHLLPGRLRRSENLGAEHILHIDLVSPASGTIICSVAGDHEPLTSDTRGLALFFAPAACHVFDVEGHRIADVEIASVATVPTLARAH